MQFLVDEVQTRWRSLCDQYVKIFKANSKDGEDIEPEIINNGKGDAKLLMTECPFFNSIYKKKFKSKQSPNDVVTISQPAFDDSSNNQEEVVMSYNLEKQTQDLTSLNVFMIQMTRWMIQNVKECWKVLKIFPQACNRCILSRMWLFNQ